MQETAHAAVQTQTCKIPGCPHDAVARLGKYAGLCSDHIALRRRNEQTGGNGASARSTSGSGPAARPTRPRSSRPGFSAKIKTLAKVARDVDKLRAEATKLTERALVAKQRADEAEREFQALARELMGADVQP